MRPQSRWRCPSCTSRLVDAGLERSTKSSLNRKTATSFVGYRLALVFHCRSKSQRCLRHCGTNRQARLDVAYRHGRVGDRNLDVVDGDLGQNALEARPATGDAISVHAQVGDAKDPRGTASDRRAGSARQKTSLGCHS